jgi:hypothetical protein
MDESGIGPAKGEVRGSVSVRQRAWTAAGILLIALGGLLLATGLIGLVADGGGAAFVFLALPPASTGFLVHRRLAAVRVSAVSVALAYAAFALYVATTPLRGLAPADGAPSAGPDLLLIVVGAAFSASAVLLFIGEPRSS